MTERTRAADITLVLDAPMEDVWRALTDPHELTRWFPLQANVDPRPGGAVAWRWDDVFAMTSRIDDWTPPRHLRLLQARERPHGADGAPLAEAAPAEVIMEFTLETMQGRTRLRLVHSGFGSGTAWDDELEGVTAGWNFELRSLAHYLTHHRGRDRHHGWAWTTTTQSPAEVWSLLAGPDGFRIPASAREPDAPFTIQTPDGTTISGTGRLHLPHREWLGTAAELDNGIVRLSTWRGGGRTGVSVWFATWNAGLRDRVAALRDAAQQFLNRHF